MRAARITSVTVLLLCACLAGCVPGWDVRVSNETYTTVTVVVILEYGGGRYGIWSLGSVPAHSTAGFRGGIYRNERGYRFWFLDPRCRVIQKTNLTYDQMLKDLKDNTLELKVTPAPASEPPSTTTGTPPGAQPAPASNPAGSG